MSKKNGIFEEDNLEKEAPLLSGIPKRNPFTVPEGYFEELPSIIMERCRQATSPVISVTQKIFWLFRPQYMLAVFIGIVGIGLFLQNRNNSPATYQELASTVTDSAIYNHLQNNIDFVDEGSLEDAVQSTYSAQKAASDTTDQQQIINYLMNHNVDASDIENEL